MKKHYFFLMLFICCIAIKSQLITENFESATFPPAGWTVQSTNPAFTWSPLTTSPVAGTRSASVAYDPALVSQDEKLISPAFSLVGATSPVLAFKSNFNPYWAITPNNNYDTVVKVSIDNGTTWTQIWSENSITVPTPAGFATYNITVPLTSLIGQSNVKLAFNYIGTDGAQWSIDDISVTAGTLSVSEAKTREDNLLVYPNPVRESFKIDLPISYSKNNTRVSVVDMSGKHIKTFEAGKESYDVSDLPKGVYFIVISDNNNKIMKKIEKR
ncbi:T9SS C-terminal target domain-containing protein [Chryseobacterium phosphatilyticum]|uniref:T9SS C-terminal target domain-containing protein n=1 Tax=Chryseobacterium phosphatilyticum TaxID=475075 RepID=A0A316XEN9_9FLAO|nr:T9SS type A sorting domain-containing protein [Chryseobacterium phosphatilyticum]PWN69230.1 T9SS C-terminal target domain-containing protein [Chryseobacterium phosphatilyticum]